MSDLISKRTRQEFREYFVGTTVVLNDRAQSAAPEQPQLHRSLNDDMLVEVLQQIALRLYYGLR